MNLLTTHRPKLSPKRHSCRSEQVHVVGMLVHGGLDIEDIEGPGFVTAGTDVFTDLPLTSKKLDPFQRLSSSGHGCCNEAVTLLIHVRFETVPSCMRPNGYVLCPNEQKNGEE